MPASTYFVSEAAVRNLKQRAERRVSGVRSAHMSEVVAAALGFRTHAALRAALHGRATTEASKPSNARAVQRLRQLGYNPPDDLHLLPELDRSYSPFKTYPLRKQRGVRWTGWRNLMVAAINAGLEQRLFGLSPGEDWWSGADPKNNGGARGLYRFTYDGDLPATAAVTAISGDELSIHVLLDPRNAQIEADYCGGIEDGAAFAHGWLERRLGAWIQDGGEDFSCKRAVQARVAAVMIEPHGYADQGSFIL
ncbi:hypothetical protein RXE43_000629 [Pseudomonas aeruginosa]|uniref:hypothetical protein n=1 Tax=Pseudomonas aeruginosa TaxID=287 RepID=UPI000AB53098|nr:hypothetical protein [Pseudomonas aeruginosa]EJV1370989.1 hypothetical protein [Pseudomonas aeruginosa]EJV1388219.1 hypothetical protein [Pseudomonas aeruginosa]EJV1611626.1 hypothetical protein [Pseudomonas aeruginosa]EKD1565273.1 hypothetical protein [Pseudomonas aeruginosa]EKJ6950645.1 hypothetical protein [Pseudomonas aeruginosa]